MRLSTKESDILYCAELRADATAKTVAQMSGYREHTVRYALRSLEDRGIIRPIGFIDVYPLGYCYYNLFFSIAAKQKKRKEKFLQALAQSPKVMFLAELGGDYQYELSLCARHIHEIIEFITTLSNSFPELFHEKATACRVSFRRFPRTYLSSNLSSKKTKTPEVSFGISPTRYEIDDLDHKILSSLSHEPLTTRRNLARRLSLPFGTLENRLRTLEKNKIISNYIYSVNCGSYGYQSFKLLLFTKGTSATLSNTLSEFARRHPNFYYIIESFGSWDFELGLEVRRAEDVPEILQEIYDQFGSFVSTIKVLTIFRRLKFSLYPFGTAPAEKNL